MEKKNIRKIIEALIFSSASPISIKDLRNYFSDDNITTKFIEQSGDYNFEVGALTRDISESYEMLVRR